MEEKKIIEQIHYLYNGEDFGTNKLACQLAAAESEYANVVNDVKLYDGDGLPLPANEIEGASYIVCPSDKAAKFIANVWVIRNMKGNCPTTKKGIYFIDNGVWKNYQTERSKIEAVLNVVASSIINKKEEENTQELEQEQG